MFWEPTRFATEALSVLSTITYRGAVAAAELILHGCVAALCAAAGMALWNSGPDARRLASIAIMAAVARYLQSLYWSTLPDNTPPGDEVPRAAVGVIVGAVAMVVIRSSRDRP
jgi:hypothetical protein